MERLLAAGEGIERRNRVFKRVASQVRDCILLQLLPLDSQQNRDVLQGLLTPWEDTIEKYL